MSTIPNLSSGAAVPFVPAFEAPPHPANGPDDQTEVWCGHEHECDCVQMQAQQLLTSAGTPELAKAALERAVHDCVAAVESAVETLAQRLGFADFQTLREASEPTLTDDGRQWFVLSMPNGDWVIWTADQPAFSAHASRDDALATLSHSGTKSDQTPA